MKILFIVPYVPSLVRNRSYSIAKHLAARGHELHLATLWTGEDEKEQLQAVSSFCQQVTAYPLPRWQSLLNCVLALPTDRPLQYVYCWQPALAHQLRSLLAGAPHQEYDVIHIEHLRGARYGMDLLSSERYRDRLPPIVWDTVDCISLLFHYTANENRSLPVRLITKFDLARTNTYEARLIRKFARTVVTSPKDREAMLNLQPGAPEERVSVISHGTDLDYFTPGNFAQRKPASLVMSGKMSYHANVAMAHYLAGEILPLIWQQKPEVELVIVGKDPPASVVEFTKDPRIQVTGTVPDIRPYLRQATLAVAPLRYGVGVQNKVLEAMASGTPVVTTPQVLTSLTAKPGKELEIGETPQRFAQAVLALLADPQQRARIGAAGRKYVEETHSWNAIVERLEEVYRSARSENYPRKLDNPKSP